MLTTICLDEVVRSVADCLIHPTLTSVRLQWVQNTLPETIIDSISTLLDRLQRLQHLHVGVIQTEFREYVECKTTWSSLSLVSLSIVVSQNSKFRLPLTVLPALKNFKTYGIDASDSLRTYFRHLATIVDYTCYNENLSGIEVGRNGRAFVLSRHDFINNNANTGNNNDNNNNNIRRWECTRAFFNSAYDVQQLTIMTWQCITILNIRVHFDTRAELTYTVWHTLQHCPLIQSLTCIDVNPIRDPSKYYTNTTHTGLTSPSSSSAPVIIVRHECLETLYVSDLSEEFWSHVYCPALIHYNQIGSFDGNLALVFAACPSLETLPLSFSTNSSCTPLYLLTCQSPSNCSSSSSSSLSYDNSMKNTSSTSRHVRVPDLHLQWFQIPYFSHLNALTTWFARCTTLDTGSDMTLDQWHVLETNIHRIPRLHTLITSVSPHVHRVVDLVQRVPHLQHLTLNDSYYEWNEKKGLAFSILQKMAIIRPWCTVQIIGMMSWSTPGIIADNSI